MCLISAHRLSGLHSSTSLTPRERRRAPYEQVGPQTSPAIGGGGTFSRALCTPGGHSRFAHRVLQLVHVRADEAEEAHITVFSLRAPRARSVVTGAPLDLRSGRLASSCSMLPQLGQKCISSPTPRTLRGHEEQPVAKGNALSRTTSTRHLVNALTGVNFFGQQHPRPVLGSQPSCQWSQPGLAWVEAWTPYMQHVFRLLTTPR